MITIETERLLIRHLTLSDTIDFFSYRADAEANKYQGWIPKSLSDAQIFLQYRTVSEPDIPDTWIQLAIILKESSNMIGDLGVYFMPERPNEVRLGYTLARSHWGMGYATEMLKAMIDHLYKDFGKTRFVALISPGNTASIKLVERLNFTRIAPHLLPEHQEEEYPKDLIYMLEYNPKVY